MKVVQCLQGSEQWFAARLGRPTASQFHRIIQPLKLKASTSQGRYMHELLAERLLGQECVDYGSAWMNRGGDMEASAVAWYSLRGADVRAVGFVTSDDGRIGCSPDRLVSEDGLLEIKCPSAAVHIGHLLGSIGDDHWAQVQGQLWLTGRKWCDVLSFNPDLPPALVRVERDGAFVAALAEEVERFAAKVDTIEAGLRVRIAGEVAA